MLFEQSKNMAAEKIVPEVNGSAFGDAFTLARVRVPFKLDSIRTPTS